MTQCGRACLDMGGSGGGHTLCLAKDERVQCAPSLYKHVMSVLRPCGLDRSRVAAEQRIRSVSFY